MRHAVLAIAAAAIALVAALVVRLRDADAARPTLRVPLTDDFELAGDGSATEWEKAPWTPLTKRGAGLPYEARFKVLYSRTGLYFLLDGSDRQVTASLDSDYSDLWTEDVFEVFLWTDERFPLYFEYEISPLGYELPILIPNLDGKFLGWRPWKYTGGRATRKKVAVQGGPAKNGAVIKRWSAEIFVPYDLLRPLTNVPPRSGSRWRANFYRVDHDNGQTTAWDWARVGPSFHEFEKFGTLEFE